MIKKKFGAASLGAGGSAFGRWRDHGTWRTGRRGAITGVATAIGGMLHTFPFLISNLSIALDVAYTVVGLELLAIVFMSRGTKHRQSRCIDK
jgi:VIT1/CCC1 family predicted Fe2+/Mn2+ transporter